MLEETLKREVLEETTVAIQTYQQLGTVNFVYPWQYQQTDMNNHICIFYEISSYQNNASEEVVQFEGQDSLGAVWVAIKELSMDNCSPLVLKAKDYLLTGCFTQQGKKMDDWSVLSNPMFGRK